jgi:hypothetical protein
MARGRTNIGKILVPALVFLLLCGIVGAEFPELLSLTDNTANDFTLRSTNSVVSPIRLDTSSHLRATDIESNTPAPGLLFSRLRSFEKAALVPSAAFILHPALRT